MDKQNCLPLLNNDSFHEIGNNFICWCYNWEFYRGDTLARRNFGPKWRWNDTVTQKRTVVKHHKITFKIDPHSASISNDAWPLISPGFKVNSLRGRKSHSKMWEKLNSRKKIRDQRTQACSRTSDKSVPSMRGSSMHYALRTKYTMYINSSLSWRFYYQ